MRTIFSLLLFSLILFCTLPAVADDLTKIVQEDLVALGYEPGNMNGELDTATIVAVSKFQAEHDLEVTGEVTPQLAGVIKAAIKNQGQPAADGATAAPAAAQAPEDEEAALRAAQQACLQEKYEQKQASAKKKRGFKRLMSAVAHTASQMGGSSMSRTIAETSYNVYGANATAGALAAAAKDLGLTEEEVEECRNPGS